MGIYRLNPTQHTISRLYHKLGLEEFSPLDISGCLVWYDFSDITTLFTDAGSTQVENDDDLIYQVNDKSGNGYHAIQATPGHRPLYKTNIQNGLSNALFDGSDDRLTYSVGSYAPSVLMVFTVFRFISVSGGRCWFQLGTEASTRKNFHTEMMNSLTKHRFGLWGDDYDVFLDDVTNTYLNVNTIDSSNVMNVYHNGTVKGASKTASDSFSGNGEGTLAAFRYGASIANYSYGYYSECIVYDSSLSDSNRNSVEAYLNKKWSIY